jgi:chromosome segregation ATPase
MSEGTPHDLPDRRSFEERVFARFDTVDAGLRDLNGRVQRLEERVERLESESERRAVETKPIWERALAEIAAVRQEVAALGQKVDALSERVDTLTERVDALTERVDKVEHKLDVFWEDMLTLRSEQRQIGKRMDRLESKPAS